MNNDFSTLQVGQDLKFPSQPENYYRVISNDKTNKKVVISQIYPRSNSHANQNLTYQQLNQNRAEVTEATTTCTNCFGSGEAPQMETIGMSRNKQYRLCKYCQGSGKMRID